MGFTSFMTPYRQNGGMGLHFPPGLTHIAKFGVKLAFNWRSQDMPRPPFHRYDPFHPIKVAGEGISDSCKGFVNREVIRQAQKQGAFSAKYGTERRRQGTPY